MKRLLFLLSLTPFLISLTGSIAYAETFMTFNDIFNQFHEGVIEQSEEINDGEPIDLPTFTENPHGKANLEPGLQSITSGIFVFLDFLKYIIAPIAVLTMVIMGVRMVLAGRENEQVMGDAKNYIRYAAEGLLFIILAHLIVYVFFGAEGEIFREGEEGAQAFGRRASSLMEGIYSLIEVVIGTIAVFVLITAGFRFVAGATSEDQISTAKRQITWSALGLFVIAIGEFVVKDILFPEQGTTLGVNKAELLFAQVTNFIAGTIGTLSFIFLLYAGFLYVTSAGDDDKVADAKRIIKGAAIGIILAASAYALTSTLIPLDPV